MRRHSVRAAGVGSRVAHERNLGRAPMWQARGTGTALLPATSVLYGREFRQIAGEPLTAADQRLFAELTMRWLDLACPQHGRVPLSLKEGPASSVMPTPAALHATSSARHCSGCVAARCTRACATAMVMKATVLSSRPPPHLSQSRCSRRNVARASRLCACGTPASGAHRSAHILQSG